MTPKNYKTKNERVRIKMDKKKARSCRTREGQKWRGKGEATARKRCQGEGQRWRGKGEATARKRRQGEGQRWRGKGEATARKRCQGEGQRKEERERPQRGRGVRWTGTYAAHIHFVLCSPMQSSSTLFEESQPLSKPFIHRSTVTWEQITHWQIICVRPKRKSPNHQLAHKSGQNTSNSKHSQDKQSVSTYLPFTYEKDLKMK